MNKHFSFLKTTLLGGIVFLLPVVLIIVVLGKAVQILLMVSEPIHELLPDKTVGGIALIYFVVLIALLLLCFFAGVLARSFIGKWLFQSIESKLLLFPGYALFKGRLTGNIGSDLDKRTLKPVLVSFGHVSKIGFRIESVSEGRFAVFLPGSPDPWSGSVVVVRGDQLEELQADMREVLHVFESLGSTASQIVR